jgi:transcriptional regulator with XRE-family HTH domain
LNLFGEQLRHLREMKKITQADVVRRLQLRGWDLDVVTFSTIELGKRSLTDIELMVILDILGARLRDLETVPPEL